MFPVWVIRCGQRGYELESEHETREQAEGRVKELFQRPDVRFARSQPQMPANQTQPLSTLVRRVIKER